METLTKDELVSCASAILDKSEVEESLLALVNKLLGMASEMLEASEQTEMALTELVPRRSD